MPAVLALAACSRPSEVAGSAQPASAHGGAKPPLIAPDLTNEPGAVFDVKYNSKMLRIELDQFIHALRSISADHSIYIFDKSSQVARSLQPGRIFLVPGLTLQKVIATAEDGPDLIVGAGEAPLTEAIQSGTIKWAHDVDFQQAARQQKLALATHTPPQAGLLAKWQALIGQLVPSAMAEESGTGDADSAGEGGWTNSTEAQADPSGLNFKLHMEKKADAAGLSATIVISGHVHNFRNAVSMLISDSKLQSFDFHNTGMTIDGNLVWTVSKEKPGVDTNEENIRLPISFSVPLIIGGLPFSLELGEAVMFKPGFTSGGELAKGGFKFQVSGDNGFKWNGGEPTSDGNSNGDGSIDDHGGVAPAAPFAILIALAAPRIELSTGPEAAFQQLNRLALVPQTLKDRLKVAIGLLSKSNAFAQWLQQQAAEALKAKGAAHVQLITSTSATIGGAAALIPCQRTQLILTGNAGLTASFFQLLQKDYEVNFFRHEKVITIPPIKGCQV